MLDTSFVITVGNLGSVVALHGPGEIKQKIFLDSLTEDAKKELLQLFTSHKATPVYILLDTIDQGYRKKTYPFIRKSDVTKLMTRDLSAIVEANSIGNFLILDNKKNKIPASLTDKKKWEALFISAAITKELSVWMEFLLDSVLNRVVGIYMLPAETLSLFRSLKNSIKTSSKIKSQKRHDLCCMLLQNKVSGTRQMVFSEDEIIFTRIINYDFNDPDFLEKYEKDIYSTLEYLKRPFPDLNIKDLDIVNIFPEEILGKISKINNIDFNLINYTPYQAASEAGFGNSIPQNSSYSDLLISKSFSLAKKKVLKFTTPKISTLEKLFWIARSTYFLNLLLMMFITFFCMSTIFIYNKLEDQKLVVKIESEAAKQSLARIKNTVLDGEIFTDSSETIDLDKILDIGKTHEVLDSLGTDIFDIYFKLGFIKQHGVKLKSFNYNLSNFTPKAPAKNAIYRATISGEIANKNGDIENLFTEFDGLTVEMKKTFDKKNIKYTELPRSIDFTKKYYTFPIDFTISNSEQ